MSNRAGLMVGLSVAALVLFALGLFALFGSDGRRQAAPSVTPTIGEFEETIPPTTGTLPTTPEVTTPGVGSPGAVSPFASPNGSPTQASPGGSPGATQTSPSPQTSPASSPTSQPPSMSESPLPSPTPALPKTGTPGASTWLAAIPLLGAFFLVRALRRSGQSVTR